MIYYTSPGFPFDTRHVAVVDALFVPLAAVGVTVARTL